MFLILCIHIHVFLYILTTVPSKLLGVNSISAQAAVKILSLENVRVNFVIKLRVDSDTHFMSESFIRSKRICSRDTGMSDSLQE